MFPQCFQFASNTAAVVHGALTLHELLHLFFLRAVTVSLEQALLRGNLGLNAAELLGDSTGTSRLSVRK